MIVLLGLFGKRRGAAVAAALAAVLAITRFAPFLPRFVSYLRDSEAFVAKYGSSAISEAVISGVFVALGLLALIATPLASRYSWGWTLPALLILPPVMLFFWLAFWFRLF
ncbi:MAG: hypothetical protein EA353_14885 [Puniceicoccaceae bacterium]|nr:MAG: hypothetical protein EA353_14885 [Puniceicoccaceae bacterium]